MSNHSADFILLGGIVLIVVAIGSTLAWWMIHDQPVGSQRFSWHQLTKNNFNVTLIDELGKTWIMDIHYNNNIEAPSCTMKGDRGLRIQLPVGYSRSEFIIFAKEISGIADCFALLVKGVVSEKELHKLNFGHDDIATYRDFKRHLLLKALKRV
ncbi:hypothetical protein OBP_308 [Pseudomonas phage OBP]|uniref:hypothetical protein n=1 Tax=Pseudomonas phage OBP TaxID=1124849 RepID=UPI000240D64F|nr:hypothetical protein OBP_308 [Pseudomonas phage OBP]AEV89745.1 hypothetical protein OBP_308 [Pseudomonas phage OBP]